MHDLTTIDSEGQAKSPASVTTQPALGQHRARAMMRSKSEATYSKSKSTRSPNHLPAVFFCFSKSDYDPITYTPTLIGSQSVFAYVHVSILTKYFSFLHCPTVVLVIWCSSKFNNEQYTVQSMHVFLCYFLILKH